MIIILKIKVKKEIIKVIRKYMERNYKKYMY